MVCEYCKAKTHRLEKTRKVRELVNKIVTCPSCQYDSFLKVPKNLVFVRELRFEEVR